MLLTEAIAILDDTHGDEAFGVAEPFNVINDPTQTELKPVIVGFGFTVTVLETELLEQPFNV